ncbi:MAG: IgGFc-binding protein [Myxococcota bacterium]
MTYLKWAPLLVGVGLGCGAPPGGGGGIGEGGSGEQTGATGGDTAAVVDDGNLTNVVDPVCTPGEIRCAGSAGIEVCAGTGLAWLFEPCRENATCHVCPEEGSCSEDRCIGPCDGIVDPSSEGCEFIANRQLRAFPEVPDAVVVANASPDLTATVDFFQIADGDNEEVLVQSVSLAPGEEHTELLDSPVIPGATTLLRSGGMMRIRSDAPITAYQHSPYKNHVGNDSSLLLPDSVLGRLYVVPSYSPHAAQHEGLGLPTYFEVVSLEKDTWIEWTSPVATAGQGAQVEAAAAGQTVRHTALGRYDRVRVAADNDDAVPGVDRDISGTVIRASDPIWVVGASRCSRVPARAEPVGGFCDPMQEVLIPVEYWGRRYVAMHPPLRDDEHHYWRVYAGRDGATFTTEPQVLTAENCAPPAVFEDGTCTLPTLGSWIEIEVPNGQSFVVEGEVDIDDALMVVGYLQSKQHPGEPDETATTIGDPAMYQTIPTEQYLKRYVFRTAEGYDPPVDAEGEPLPIGTRAGNYVQIVRPLEGATVFLDGEGVNGWESVGEFEFATVRILSGAHTVESNDFVGVSVFGFSNAEVEDREGCLEEEGRCASSYAYPGGMRLEFLVPP